MPRPRRQPRLEFIDGVYRVVWYDPDQRRTRRYSLRTADEEAARRRFAAWLAEGERIEQETGAGILTVDTALDLYLQEHVYATRSDGTPKVAARERIDWIVANLRPHFGSVAVPDLTHTHVLDYEARRRAGTIGRRAGDGTVRRELGCLVAALNHNVRARRLKADDVPHIALPDKPPPKDRWLTPAEMDRLMKTIPIHWPPPKTGDPGKRIGRLYRFVMIARHTAARQSAIRHLTWPQVDLERGIIDFKPAGARQSSKRRPVVPIANVLRHVLECAFAEKTSLYVLDHPGAIRHQLERACVRAGLEDVTPHTFRHTWATWAAQDGVDLWKIAGILGDDVATVTRNYAHHHPDHLRDAVDRERKVRDAH